MELIRCGKGHYYDKSKGNCPICSAESIVENTVLEGFFDKGIPTEIHDEKPITPAADPVIPLDIPLDLSESDLVPPSWLKREGILDDYQVSESEDRGPVVPLEEHLPVGWLVCLSGADKGMSHRLHAGTNFIGRGADMDVCIKNDQSVSTRNHASVSYDERGRVFYITKGEVRNPTYLNGRSVRSDADLNQWDIIEVGATKLMFVPLCGKKFNW